MSEVVKVSQRRLTVTEPLSEERAGHQPATEAAAAAVDLARAWERFWAAVRSLEEANRRG